MLVDEMANALIVIVDFDGTIIYLETDWQSLRNELKDYCAKELHIKESFESLDTGLFRIKHQFGSKVFEKLLEKVSFYEMQGYKGGKIDEVIQPLLLLPKEKKIAIFSSNCKKTIESIIPELGLNISYIVAKEDVNEHKPSGEGIRKILGYFSAKPKEAIFVGDSDLDLKAGQEAGVKTLLWRNVRV